METYVLYRQFAKPPDVTSSKQDTADFWMELLLQYCHPGVTTERCPVSKPVGEVAGSDALTSRLLFQRVVGD